MAISGNIVIPAFGTTITLDNKYMRLRQVMITNEWRNAVVAQPPGADGLPVSPKLTPVRVYMVSGILDVYNASTDPEANIAPISGASQEYSCDFTPGTSDDAQAQLYKHIMSLLPAGATMV